MCVSMQAMMYWSRSSGCGGNALAAENSTLSKRCAVGGRIDSIAARALPPHPLERDQYIIAGMETHICVYQTARGIVARGLNAYVAIDAACSRTKLNWKVGRDLIEKDGARVTSTETIVFDLLGRAGTDEFKAISRLIK